MIDKICFVFSTDDNYAMPTAVAISSLVEHNQNLIKKIVVLYKERLSNESVALIEKSSRLVEVEFIDIEERITYTYDKIPHISAAAYYRMAIPSVLLHEERCVYLDGDVLVRRSLDSFVSLDMDDETYIAAVRCPAVANSLPSTLKKHARELEIPNLKSYINSGVQLMNLDAIRKKGVDKMMIDLIPNNYSIQDQDIFNKACYGHIRVISPIYNCTTYVFDFSKRALKKAYSDEWIADSRKNPAIVHYASAAKPWKNTGMPFQKEWDEACLQLTGSLPNGRTVYKKTTIIDRIVKRLFKFKR